MNLSQGRFRLGSRRRFSTQREVEHIRLLRAVVTAPSLSSRSIGTVLSVIGWDCWGALCRTRSWTR